MEKKLLPENYLLSLSSCVDCVVVVWLLSVGGTAVVLCVTAGFWR